MIAELVYLLLSVLIRFTPVVRTRPIRQAKRSLAGEHWAHVAFWMPVAGWVVVSLYSTPQGWLTQRVASAHYLGRSSKELDAFPELNDRFEKPGIIGTLRCCLRRPEGRQAPFMECGEDSPLSFYGFMKRLHCWRERFWRP